MHARDTPTHHPRLFGGFGGSWIDRWDDVMVFYLDLLERIRHFLFFWFAFRQVYKPTGLRTHKDGELNGTEACFIHSINARFAPLQTNNNSSTLKFRVFSK
jgi:hypothetical protein